MREIDAENIHNMTVNILYLRALSSHDYESGAPLPLQRFRFVWREMVFPRKTAHEICKKMVNYARARMRTMLKDAPGLNLGFSLDHYVTRVLPCVFANSLKDSHVLQRDPDLSLEWGFVGRFDHNCSRIVCDTPLTAFDVFLWSSISVQQVVQAEPVVAVVSTDQSPRFLEPAPTRVAFLGAEFQSPLSTARPKFEVAPPPFSSLKASFFIFPIELAAESLADSSRVVVDSVGDPINLNDDSTKVVQIKPMGPSLLVPLTKHTANAPSDHLVAAATSPVLVVLPTDSASSPSNSQLETSALDAVASAPVDPVEPTLVDANAFKNWDRLKLADWLRSKNLFIPECESAGWDGQLLIDIIVGTILTHGFSFVF
jgi:hypothetical protein